MNKKTDLRKYKLTWTFHRNSCRWAHNAMSSSGQDEVPEPGLEDSLKRFINLPELIEVDESFASLIEKRCSCRDFSSDMIDLKQLSTLLHYSYGVIGTDHWGASEFLERPIPSGGGMYPMELYVLSRGVNELNDGVYHYVPLLNGLEEIRELRIPDPLISYLFMGQYPVLKASVIILISAVTDRTMKKYGDRGYRYLLIEAGHIAQNLNLAAVGLDLQSLNLGGFFDDEIGALCEFQSNKQITLYAIAVGKGVSKSKHRLRFSEDPSK